MEQHNYVQLKSLKDSDFQIVDGEPNIIGWEVKNEANAYLGKVRDLLFEPQSRAVRYLIVDLGDNGMNLGDKKVMIPIGIAHLQSSGDEVVLPNVHVEQFNTLPNYDENKTVPATEIQIRQIIGSPAALRIEESISEFDQNQFYTHHHFDKERFYQRGRSNENLTSQEISGTASMADRVEEEKTIHELIDHSKSQNFNAADQNTGINTHHNEHKEIHNWDSDKPGGDDEKRPPYLPH